MSRTATILALGLVCLVALPAGADAETKLSYKGVYTAWLQSQHNFTLGRVNYDDNYAVQMLRMNLTFAPSEYVQVKTRFDMAQGWWGVDNADRTVNRTGSTGGSSLFDFKDTNFLFHVDQAYAAFQLPDAPVHVQVGRMWYGLGNKMLLDNNMDGIQVVVDDRFRVSYAKVSEGVDGLTDAESSDSAGNIVADGDDAHLVTAAFDGAAESLNYSLFGMLYVDAGDDDGTTYMPNDINYFRSRFTPHLSQVIAFGGTADYKNKDNGVTASAEVDVLFGKDDVMNTTIDGAQLVDVNDGDLKGFNLYLKANKQLSPKFNAGIVVGMGSGDDDVTSGDGNINKLRTSGFFYLTEVWEDSIMPDEEGITPQGLGAPNVRAYRELENTTVIQGNAKVKLHDKVSLFGSYTYLMATEAVHSWSVDTSGTTPVTVIGAESADDIGSEIDWKLDYQMYPQLAFSFRGGVFFPGDAAGYLINGTNTFDDPAWEYKGTVTLKF